ncbi:MAG: hypothetical protein OES18_13135, partial [Deltaproteobacteria bacterium]|nr:hypothetical protein [Deltaproteobacteria bacterium]
ITLRSFGSAFLFQHSILPISMDTVAYGCGQGQACSEIKIMSSSSSQPIFTAENALLKVLA